MLAKKPEDRYQTPAEVIAALAPWLGNSSRVLAGISRTKLAQGADLQATLAEVGRGSGSRRAQDDDDSDEVEVDRSRETGAVASAITTRERPRTAKKKKAAAVNRRQIYLYSAIAVGVLIIGVLGAWAAFGGSKKKTDEPSADNRTPQDPGQPAPKGGTPPKGTDTPKGGTPKKDGPTKDVSVFKFDPATMAKSSFKMKGSSVVEGQRANFPPGMSPTLKNADVEAEFVLRPVDGVPALTITRTSTALGAQAWPANWNEMPPPEEWA